jgi:hypothetical protein
VSPQTASVVSAAQSFNTTFDVASQQFFRLTLSFPAASGQWYSLAQMQVGPGQIVQGAAVSEWQSYTPSLGAGWGTPASIVGKYRRVGSSVQIAGSFSYTSGTGATGSIGLPLGLTVKANVTNEVVGELKTGAGVVTADNIRHLIATQGNTYVEFGRTGTANSPHTATAPNNIGTSANITFQGIVDVNEWAGSVYTAPVPAEEFAFNSTTTDADDTASFAYGPGGVQFASFTAVRSKRIRFQYPRQADDEVVLEYTEDGGSTWVAIGGLNTDRICAFQRQASNFYGMHLVAVSGSTTDVDVQFGVFKSVSSSATYGASGVAWTSVAGSSTFKWRVRKTKKAALPFANAGTDGSAGLYKAGSAPGLVTGATIAAGYVGEMLGTLRSGTNGFTYSTRTTTSPSTSYASLVSVTLNKGVYLIYGNLNCALSVAGQLYGYVAVGGTQVSNAISQSAAVGFDMAMAVSAPVTISADGTAVAIFGKLNATTGLVVNGHELFAVRIA